MLTPRIETVIQETNGKFDLAKVSKKTNEIRIRLVKWILNAVAMVDGFESITGGH